MRVQPPKLGGLERRANLVKSIRDRGWPVAGFDLGDVPPAAIVRTGEDFPRLTTCYILPG